MFCALVNAPLSRESPRMVYPEELQAVLNWISVAQVAVVWISWLVV